MALSQATLPSRICAYSPSELAPRSRTCFSLTSLTAGRAVATSVARAARKGSSLDMFSGEVSEMLSTHVLQRPRLRRNSLVAPEVCYPESRITGGISGINRKISRSRVRVVAASAVGSSSGDAAGSSSAGIEGAASGGESVKELKQRLLRAVGGTQRGKAASPQQREQILQLIEQLEAANPTPSPMLSPLLAGTWALVYIAPTEASTNTLDASEEGPFLARLKPAVFGGVRQKASLQIIHPDEGRAENVALFTAWGVDGELQIDAECKAPEQESMRGVRSTVRFLSFKLSLGPLSFTLPLSLISPTGWIDVTYIDEEMRVTRGDKGSVFLATRVKA